MEYEKENGDYLELKVYLEKIEVYQVINNAKYEETLASLNYLNKVKYIVSDFIKE